jgi:hypothetical protein
VRVDRVLLNRKLEPFVGARPLVQWIGPVARPRCLRTGQHKHRYRCPQLDSIPTPVFERAKIIRSVDRVAAVICKGKVYFTSNIFDITSYVGVEVHAVAQWLRH